MVQHIFILYIWIQIVVSQIPPPPKTSHVCTRSCTGGIPKYCIYNFHVEWYTTLTSACFTCPSILNDCFKEECISLDGIRYRTLQVINRQYPGPKIEVCEADLIEVRVKNDFKAEATTFHWHGQHQKGTPYMDGVPYVTQCPIHPEGTFIYKFIASQKGTHFWHSHLSLQRGNGHFGALIVRPHRKRCEKFHYDYDLSEHIIVISDLTTNPVNDVFINHYFNQVDEFPRSILVNGLGRFRSPLYQTTAPQVPSARFVVSPGKRYLFRIISSASADNPIVMRFSMHMMLVVASDGKEIDPILTNSLTLLAGERYDVVVTANQVPSLYWIYFRGYVEGELGKTFQACVLQYAGQSATAYPSGPTPTFENSGAFGNQVNGYNMPVLPPPFTNVPVNEFRSYVDNVYEGEPFLKLFLAYDIEPKFTNRFQLQKQDPGTPLLPLTENPQFNGISLAVPSVPLLSQFDELPPNYFCNENTKPVHCPEPYCSCPYVHEVPLGALIEVILIDEGKLYDVSHPIHLHGHYFAVLDIQKLGNSTSRNEVEEYDKQGGIVRNYNYPPLKDTVAVPDGGFIVIRFIADNPGFWLCHCHIEFHAELGMAMIFKIGDYSEFPPVPNKFPECRDYFNE